ncbi:MAG TPA: sulfatase-like hydrolase/transferase [Bryocella sp.]|nr:sulfatase-like hydrolase/transferase [Bryocella sp.]
MSHKTSRRNFLRSAALTTGALAAPAEAISSQSSSPKRQPNILMICADQFRTDFIGANNANPSVRTPHLNALAARGVNFRHAVCNQPLCSPSRASFLTGVTATQAKVWRLGLELDHSIPSIASVLKSSGYTTAFCGKWHVSKVGPGPEREVTRPGQPVEKLPNTDSRGLVPRGPSRAGFDDVFEGANVLEIVSHPYEGNYWDTSGNNIGFRDEYRVDFITDRSVEFIRQPHDKPWLLFVSQLEPHQQNDVDRMVPPKRYADTYDDAFVPHDLRQLPGNWQTRLPGYYGCVQAIDDCVGKLTGALEASGQLDNTIIVFFSDHGCTFRTRLGEYKRSPHDASIRVPLLFAGPGFEPETTVDEVVSLIDMTPTLLNAAGAEIPSSMTGKSLLPLTHGGEARKNWPSEAYIQISSSICGRAIRTKDWMYCAYDPAIAHGNAELSHNYTDFALYSIGGDPYQQVNLVGREMYRDICDELRDRLKQMIVAHGEPEPTITPHLFYA